MDSLTRKWAGLAICLIVILVASANQSFACPDPFCEACQKWDANVPGCVNDDAQDEGGDIDGDCGYCKECSDGDCVSDDAAGNSADVCFGCKSCQSGECASDDDECTGCLGCFGFTCDIKHSNCPGECNHCMSDGSCQKFDVLCLTCQKCDATTGNCVDDGTTCTGCKTCNSSTGGCEDDDAPECSSETCDKCIDGTCVPGGLCTEGLCCDNGTCVSSCSGSLCCEDSVCVTSCSGDNCCDGGICEPLEGCEKCIDNVATDYKPNCTAGPCENCTDAQCHDDNALCPANDVCVNGVCCDTASDGDCVVTDEDLDYAPDNCSPAPSGACKGGLGGGYIAYGWEQESTHQHQTGPGTVDLPGCAKVTYATCSSYFGGEGSSDIGWNCLLDDHLVSYK